MKRIRIFTGDDGESHIEPHEIAFTERDGVRSLPEGTSSIEFAIRKGGNFIDFHPAPRRQYVLYLTASVEIGLGDGTTIVMEPGDALQAEDTTGRGHTSRVVKEGICAFVPLTEA
ncbi:MAG: hypothetical protein R3C39_06900 [Dehalococcoidia bacterium]